MPVVNSPRILEELNGCWIWKADLSGASAQNTLLEVGKTYRLVNLAQQSYIGFGETAALANTASGSTKGELFDVLEKATFSVTAGVCQYISRTPVGTAGDVRILELQRP
jgi:hypothetical protein